MFEMRSLYPHFLIYKACIDLVTQFRPIPILLVSCNKMNKHGGGGQKIRKQEHVSPIKVVKQLKVTN